MPFYDLKCRDCEKEEEVFKKASKDNPPCSACLGQTDIIITNNRASGQVQSEWSAQMESAKRAHRGPTIPAGMSYTQAVQSGAAERVAASHDIGRPKAAPRKIKTRGRG